MRNQTLVVERSALGRNSLMNIMSNELERRLEVLHDDLPQVEVNSVINKYTQQLINSEYNWKQCRDIVVSALLGYCRKENRRKELAKPKYRSSQDSLLIQESKKLLAGSKV